jgi:N-acetylmuramoyl-L-alanine amidase
MALILGGKQIPCEAKVVDWHEHGMEHSIGEGHNKKRSQQIDLFVLHWTGGEGDEKQMHRVLETRELGVEFYIRQDGVVFQYADPLLVDTADSGFVNPRSIGVEISNYGFRKVASEIPEAGKARPLYSTKQQGRKRTFAAYWPAQLTAAIQLTDAVIGYDHPGIKIPRCVPRAADGSLLTTTMTTREVRNYSGVLGHFHISKMKSDPGTDIFDAFIAAGYR